MLRCCESSRFTVAYVVMHLSALGPVCTIIKIKRCRIRNDKKSFKHSNGPRGIRSDPWWIHSDPPILRMNLRRTFYVRQKFLRLALRWIVFDTGGSARIRMCPGWIPHRNFPQIIVPTQLSARRPHWKCGRFGVVRLTHATSVALPKQFQWPRRVGHSSPLLKETGQFTLRVCNSTLSKISSPKKDDSPNTLWSSIDSPQFPSRPCIP